MANKREFKKRVRTICGELASDAMIAATLFPKEVNREKVNILINEIAALQEDTIALTSFSFDKAPRDYESLAVYHSERRKYFATAYKKLNKDFIDRALEIVKQLNDVVPENARRTVSAL